MAGCRARVLAARGTGAAWHSTTSKERACPTGSPRSRASKRGWTTSSRSWTPRACPRPPCSARRRARRSPHCSRRPIPSASRRSSRTGASPARCGHPTGRSALATTRAANGRITSPSTMGHRGVGLPILRGLGGRVASGRSGLPHLAGKDHAVLRDANGGGRLQRCVRRHRRARRAAVGGGPDPAALPGGARASARRSRRRRR